MKTSGKHGRMSDNPPLPACNAYNLIFLNAAQTRCLPGDAPQQPEQADQFGT